MEISEEIARSLESDEYQPPEEFIEWYAIEICEAFASVEKDVTPLVEHIQEHWSDFEDVDDIEEVFELSNKKQKEI